MVMEEKRAKARARMRAKARPRAGEAAESPRKSPRLEPPAAATADSGCDDAAFPAASDRCEESAASSSDSDSDVDSCSHFEGCADEIESIFAEIEYSVFAPKCEHKLCGFTRRSGILVCTECRSYHCAQAVAKEKPQGHARWHAENEGHSFAVWYNKPHLGYCFLREHSVPYLKKTEGLGEITVANDNDDVVGHASELADELVQWKHNASGYVVRGIPNLGNTCYLNALVQCLLVLGKLRERMLGPDAPTGDFLGIFLRDLFEDTNRANNVRQRLDPVQLLDCIRQGDSRFKGNNMQDSHELLVYLRSALGQEGAPTVPDAIFGGQLRVTRSCKCCSIKSVSHDVFYDLSVSLPAKEPPAKSVASSPSNKGRRTRRDIHMNLLPEMERDYLKKEMERDKEKIQAIAEPIAKSVASSPSSTSCRSQSKTCRNLLAEMEGGKEKIQATPEPIAKSIASSPRNKSSRSQKNTGNKLDPGLERLKAKIEAEIAEGDDFQIPDSKLQDVFMEKTPRPLEKVDSTEVEQIWQSEGVVHDPLQTQKDDAPGEIIEVPVKAVDVLPHDILFDVQVQGMDEPTDDSFNLWDIGPSPLVSPSREKNELKASGSDVKKNENAGFDESRIEVKENTYAVKITTEDKGKAWSSDIVYDEAEDISSLASIEDCLALHFKTEVIEWFCENCHKVAERLSANTSKDREQMVATTNENTAVDGDQTEQTDKKICQSGQSSNLKSLAVECTSSRQPHDSDAQHQFILRVDRNTEGITSGMNCNGDSTSCSTANKKPECQEAVPDCLPTEKQTNVSSVQDSQNASTLNQDKGKQVKLDHSARQAEENKNELKDTSGYATETQLFSKLPPVLIIHLKRSVVGHVKVRGHVRFKEILDVGPFMDPSSEDKDNTSYRLAGVIEHCGGLSAAVGHYVAYVRSSHHQQSTGSSSWFFASDTTIREVSLKDVLTCEAYILFYERMES